MIRCVNVHKHYHSGERDVHALRGVDMDVPEPGFYAIMGASGSGKSTLLHLLAALDTPDEGEVHVSGVRIDTMNERDLTHFRAREVGVVFQQFNLLPTMTALENVELPGMLLRRPARETRARATELLESLGVSHRASHRPDALSGGEQQRVAIARALLFSPRVLLADEPTGALDSTNSRALWALLARVAREHEMSIVMVTHEQEAASHCRRVFVLSDGRVTQTIEQGGAHDAGVATRQ